MATTDVLGDPNQERRARRFARDGLLFLGLSFAAGAVCVALNFLAPRGSQELLTGFGVGGASTLIFAGMGLMKLTQARRAGLNAIGLGAAELALAFYLALMFVAICGYLLPLLLERQLGRYTAIVSWSLPLLVCLVPLIVKMRRAAATPLQRSGCAIAASFLCWIYIDGLIGCQSGRWLLFGTRAMEDQGYGLWLQPQLDFIGPLIVVGVAGLAFLAIAALVLRNEIRNNGKTPAAARLRVWARCSAAWLLLIVVGLLCKQIPTYWGVAAVLLFGGGAVLLGSKLAQWRQRAPISLRRRVMFTSPFLLLAVPLVLMAGIAGSAYSAFGYYWYDAWSFSYNPAYDWAWHLPESIRAPLARLLGRCSMELDAGVYLNGLSSEADLQTAAIKPGTALRYYGSAGVWQAWCLRDPRAALAVARNVASPPAGSNLPSTNYDMGAGCAIGKLGSDAEIRAHLAGGYSIFLKFGILMSLTPEQRMHLRKEIVDYFKLQPYDPQALNWFARLMPADFHRLAIESIDAPSPSNPALLKDLLLTPYRPSDLITYALSSQSKVVRACAMRGIGIRGPVVGDVFLQPLIKSMQGTQPNADVDEQRAAAQLVSRLLMPKQHWIGPPGTPLTPTEQTELDALVKKAQEWLTARGATFYVNAIRQ